MTVELTSEALGKAVGATHTGPEEAWLLANGYAKQAGLATKTAATLAGTTNAVNIVTGGNLVLAVGHKQFTVAIATADTPAQAATKIDTALAGFGDSSIVSSKLNVVSVATGYDAYVRAVSGTGTVLANLGLTAGQEARGSDGGVGVSNTGPSDTTPANDLQAAANREPAPEYDIKTGLPKPGPVDPALTFSTADDDPADVDADYDFDAGAVNDEAPTVDSVSPATGLAAGGTPVEISGRNFTGSTGGSLGGVALTSFVVVDDNTVTGVSGAHAAGAVTAAVTNPTGTGSKATAYTYA